LADPADIPQFMTDLADALRQGKGNFLFSNLHPAVLDRYGEQACRRFTASATVDGLHMEYIGSDGPGPWDWVLDDLTTTIEDAWSVTVVWRQPGAEEQRDVRIAPADGSWRWFTDCGDPLT